MQWSASYHWNLLLSVMFHSQLQQKENINFRNTAVHCPPHCFTCYSEAQLRRLVMWHVTPHDSWHKASSRMRERGRKGAGGTSSSSTQVHGGEQEWRIVRHKLNKWTEQLKTVSGINYWACSTSLYVTLYCTSRAGSSHDHCLLQYINNWWL